MTAPNNSNVTFCLNQPEANSVFEHQIKSKENFDIRIISKYFTNTLSFKKELHTQWIILNIIINDYLYVYRNLPTYLYRVRTRNNKSKLVLNTHISTKFTFLRSVKLRKPEHVEVMIRGIDAAISYLLSTEYYTEEF